MTTRPQSILDQISTHVRGRVWLPDDTEFDQVRRAWNLSIDQSPCAVVEAADAADVASLLGFASTHGIPVATQPSGHGATGRTEGSILLRTTLLSSISVDPEARTARIGAGVRSGDLQRATAEHGLTAMPGSSPVVSVTGVALGGGLSWFGRAFGWVADSIVAADVVLADGTARHVDASDADLLWALRGGGGEIAVVTALELRLQPAPSAFGGRQLWPASRAREVAEVYCSITETAPETLTLWFELLHFPGAEPMVAIDSTFLGAEETARELLGATDRIPDLLSDSRTTMTVAELGQITAEPTDPVPARSRCELLTALDDAALDVLLGEPIAPLMAVQVRHLGGALARPSNSPHGPLTEPFAVYMLGIAATAGHEEAAAMKQAELAAALPVSGRKPLALLNRTERLSDALPDASVERLRRLKAEHDPAGIIHGNVPLPDGA